MACYAKCAFFFVERSDCQGLRLQQSSASSLSIASTHYSSTGLDEGILTTQRRASTTNSCEMREAFSWDPSIRATPSVTYSIAAHRANLALRKNFLR